MRKAAIVAVALPVVLLLGAGALVIVRVQRLVGHTRSEVLSAGQLEYELRTLSERKDTGFEALASPTNYSSGIQFQGKLYLAGAGGLSEFASLEQAPRMLRVGIDLPAAPIVGMVAGTVRGEAHAELILATRGEGVLFYGGSVIRQLRPKDAAARDVTAVLPLASGDLLIGTRRMGLLIYDGKVLAPFQSNLANVAVTALAGDEGDLWIGTHDNGVMHWHGGQMESFDASSGSHIYPRFTHHWSKSM